MRKFFERYNEKAVVAASAAITGYIVYKTVHEVKKRREEKARQQELKLAEVALKQTVVYERAQVEESLRKSLASGRAEDKINALEAANAADRERGERWLGRKALHAIVDKYVEENPHVRSVQSPDFVGKGMRREWISSETARRFRAVTEAMGNHEGIIVTEPKTEEDYLDASHIIDGNRSFTESAKRLGLSLAVINWDVEGTAFMYDAATRALSHENTRATNGAVSREHIPVINDSGRIVWRRQPQATNEIPSS